MKQDNYQKMRDQMRVRFLDYDQEEMIQKFNLKSDENYLYIWFCGCDYRISRTSGVVEWSEDQFLSCTEGGFNESMTIYDVLCCSKPDCHLSGEYMMSSGLQNVAHTGWSAGSRGMFSKYAPIFEKDMDRLKQACVTLGGVQSGRGDVAYRIPLFEFLPVQFAFWQSDEDFPAEVQLLWDKNVLDYMHYETLWYAAGHLMKRLEELIWMR